MQLFRGHDLSYFESQVKLSVINVLTLQSVAAVGEDEQEMVQLSQDLEPTLAHRDAGNRLEPKLRSKTKMKTLTEVKVRVGGYVSYRAISASMT